MRGVSKNGKAPVVIRRSEGMRGYYSGGGQSEGWVRPRNNAIARFLANLNRIRSDRLLNEFQKVHHLDCRSIS